MSQPSYEIAGHEVLAETPELRMVVLTLAAGQEVPWHWHSNVADRFFCMEGPMVVETRAPREIFELDPGGTCIVPAKRAHRVTGKNGGPCKFGVLQGVGIYDFNPVGSKAPTRPQAPGERVINSRTPQERS
jgi:quercetin dioxygenase-like cupin family protein